MKRTDADPFTPFGLKWYIFIDECDKIDCISHTLNIIGHEGVGSLTANKQHRKEEQSRGVVIRKELLSCLGQLHDVEFGAFRLKMLVHSHLGVLWGYVDSLRIRNKLGASTKRVFFSDVIAQKSDKFRIFSPKKGGFTEKSLRLTSSL